MWNALPLEIRREILGRYVMHRRMSSVHAQLTSVMVMTRSALDAVATHYPIDNEEEFVHSLNKCLREKSMRLPASAGPEDVLCRIQQWPRDLQIRVSKIILFYWSAGNVNMDAHTVKGFCELVV